jgi:tetratricopeptide (TPR) repeat protein
VNVNNSNFTQAITDFNKTIEIDPDMAEAYKMRGLVHIVLQDPRHAMDDLNKAMELDDSDPMAYLYRGHLNNANQDYDRAIDDLDRALVLASSSNVQIVSNDPFHVDISSMYLERAISKRSKQLLNEAVEDAQKAVQLDPGSALKYGTLGEILITNADIENGLAAINKAIGLDPTIAENYINRAAAYDILAQQTKDQRYYTLLAADLEKVIELSKDPLQIEDARASLRYMQSKGYIQ